MNHKLKAAVTTTNSPEYLLTFICTAYKLNYFSIWQECQYLSDNTKLVITPSHLLM